MVNKVPKVLLWAGAIAWMMAGPATAGPFDGLKKTLENVGKEVNSLTDKARQFVPGDKGGKTTPPAGPAPQEPSSESTVQLPAADSAGKTGRGSRGGSSSSAGCVNNTFRCAKTVSIGQRVEGFIDTGANRRQVFKVAIESPGRHRVSVFKEVVYPLVDFKIFDESQKEIYGQSFNDRERNFDVIFNAPGVYYLSFYNSPGCCPTFAFDFTIQPLPASKF